jgi:hypothetical protein
MLCIMKEVKSEIVANSSYAVVAMMELNIAHLRASHVSRVTGVSSVYIILMWKATARNI